MKTIYKVTANETLVTATASKREYLNAVKALEGEAQVELIIPTTNVRRLLNKGAKRVKVEADTGKTYTTTATYDPEIYGDKKEDPKKAVQARKSGKALVYNTAAKNWQALNIIAIEVEGVWFSVMKVEALSKPRLSLERALETLTALGYTITRTGNKFEIEDNGQTFERTGRELVRFAREVA